MFEKNDDTDQLTYLAQTEKQTSKGSATANANPEWRKTFKLSFDSRAEGRKLRFNVYDIASGSKAMDDEDRIGSCMFHIKELVDNAGIDFVFKLTHEGQHTRALTHSGSALSHSRRS
jgi:hypothetical protein